MEIGVVSIPAFGGKGSRREAADGEGPNVSTRYVVMIGLRSSGRNKVTNTKAVGPSAFLARSRPSTA